jgi:hypothetical protein
MMLRHPEEVRTSLGDSVVSLLLTHHRIPFQRETIVRELVLSLAMAGRERDALDELELCGSPDFSPVSYNPTRAMQLPSVTSVPRQLRVAYVRGSPLFTARPIFFYGCQLQP